MRIPPIALLAAMLFAFAANSAVGASGVNLRWDACYGDGGVQYQMFACDTNVGTHRLVGSFELAEDYAGVTGIEVTLDLGSMSTPLPAWWQFFTLGTCRRASLTSALVPPPTAAACADWAQGLAAGGIATYQIGNPSPDRVHLRLATAVALPVDLFAGQEYFNFILNMDHAKTVGTGACAGCSDPVVVYLTMVNVVQGASSNRVLNRGANGDLSQWVSWQDGYPINVQLPCLPQSSPPSCVFPITTFTVVPHVTPTRASTWGAVKSLYR